LGGGGLVADENAALVDRRFRGIATHGVGFVGKFGRTTAMDVIWPDARVASTQA